MDILKYVFHIDPVKAERKKVEKAHEEKRTGKANVPAVAVRFQYIA